MNLTSAARISAAGAPGRQRQPLQRRGSGLVLIGVASILTGMVFAPGRVSPNVLLASFMLLGMGLAALAFIALNYVAGASWNVAFRRVAEAVVACIPAGAAGVAMVLLLQPSLYPWTHGAEFSGFKGMWLSLPFFLLRAAVFFAAWLVFAWAIVRASRKQDANGAVRHTLQNTKLSAAFLVVFGITFWLASTDWIMSLEPHWYSTVFGIYNFSGMFLAGLAAMIALLAWLRQSSPLRDFVRDEHFHDLGKLMFAFSSFWMYIWFCQFMLIWYANFPEETAYFTRRLDGFWRPVFFLNVVLNWGIPFLTLMPRRVKRTAATLVKVAGVVLVGRWVDLYLMIMPANDVAATFGVWELGIVAGALGVFLLVVNRALGLAPLVPVNDPRLVESLEYRN